MPCLASLSPWLKHVVDRAWDFRWLHVMINLLGFSFVQEDTGKTGKMATRARSEAADTLGPSAKTEGPTSTSNAYWWEYWISVFLFTRVCLNEAFVFYPREERTLTAWASGQLIRGLDCSFSSPTALGPLLLLPANGVSFLLIVGTVIHTGDIIFIRLLSDVTI